MAHFRKSIWPRKILWKPALLHKAITAKRNWVVLSLHFCIYIAGEMIKQLHNPFFSTAELFTKKRNVGSPPCERFGCGKREIFAQEKGFPKSYFASKIRQLQLKRAQKRFQPPSRGRTGCDKRKWKLPSDFKFISVTMKVCLCLKYGSIQFSYRFDHTLFGKLCECPCYDLEILNEKLVSNHCKALLEKRQE